MLFNLSHKIGGLVAELFDPSSLARIYAKLFKILDFFRQNGTKFVFFSPLALNLLEVDTLKLRTYSS